MVACAHILKVINVRCWRLHVHPLYPPLAPMGPEVSITHQGPKSLPTNKMIASITLMIPNYITSLNVGEQAI